MNHWRIITILLLVILFDRVESLYYGLSNPERLIGFLYMGDPIRADSYVYFASLRVQHIIFAVIVSLSLPKWLNRETSAYIIVNILYFAEYFITYNRPVTRLMVIPEVIYLPVSITTLKILIIMGIVVSALNKIFNTFKG